MVVVDLGEEMSHPMKLPLLDYFVDPCTIHRSCQRRPPQS